MSPFFSIVVPAFNASRYIAATLESVFAQTFTDFEVIVVNDGSPDSEALDAAVAPYLTRILYVTQQNTGVAGARNRAIEMATGTYIAFLDSDDLWEPRCLDIQRETLLATNADVVYGDGVIFGDPSLEGVRLMQKMPSSGPVTLASLVCGTCVVFLSATAARRDLVRRVGIFDLALSTAEDLDLWLRIVMARGLIVYHDSPIIRYRRHAGSLSSSAVRLGAGVVQVMHKCEELELTAAERVAVKARIARAESEIAWELGQEALKKNLWADAVRHWSAANLVKRDWRVSAAIVLLRISPWLFSYLHRWRASR